MNSAHAHSHGGGHDHCHATENFNRAFGIGVVLNIAFVAIEAYYGWKINSLALLADAGHNLSDVAGLLLAWGGLLAGKLPASPRHTYGFKRATILAAFINATLLLVAMGSLGWEAIGRLQSPEPTQAWTVMTVAGIGIVINTATALMFLRGGQNDLNIRGAYLHMAADAVVSLAVLVGGALYLWQGWGWIDPILSLGIAMVIVWSTWQLLRQSVHLLFDGVPVSVELSEVRDVLLGLEGVSAVHDLHVWAMGTSDTALTAHLVLTDATANATDAGDLLRLADQALHDQFDIRHMTLQLESPAYGQKCNLRCDANAT
jgi:cobalt-zinc-cadmium efflux system protein